MAAYAPLEATNGPVISLLFSACISYTMNIISEGREEGAGESIMYPQVRSRYTMTRCIVIFLVTVISILSLHAPSRGGEIQDFASVIIGDDFPRLKIMISNNPGLVYSIGTAGWRPLHYAAAMNRKRALLALIAGGADISARDDEQWTPLHMAAHQGHREFALILISRGADINARDKDGWTPLHCALNSHRDEDFNDIARKLIECGADIHARTVEGKTPLLLALERGKEEIVALLRQKGAGE